MLINCLKKKKYCAYKIKEKYMEPEVFQPLLQRGSKPQKVYKYIK